MNAKGQPWFVIAMLAAAALVSPAHSQHFEGSTPNVSEPAVIPYLPPNAIDFRTLLASPPAQHSSADTRDQAIVLEFQSASEARFQSAMLDGAFVYPRFEAAFAGPIDRANAPALIRMLNRAMADVAEVTFQAKEHFLRPRPYQRFQLARVCGVGTAPAPEINPTIGSSYPSGHSAYGWATAMVLARVRPDLAEALLARAADFAESRVVCGVHFPSDVEAGQVIAAAVVARLDADASFQADLAAARAEVEQVRSLPSSH